MKFVSFIIVATFAYAVIVSAAPSTSNPSVDDSALTSVGGIVNEIKENLRKFTCVTGVAAKVLITVGLKKEFNELKNLVEFIGHDIAMCRAGGSVGDYLKCELEVVKSIPEYLTAFTESLAEKNKEIAVIVLDQVATKCESYNTFALLFNFAEADAPDQKPQGFVKKLKCMNAAIGEAVKDTDFATAWGEFEKEMDIVEDHIKACKTETTNWGAVKCTAKEMKRTNALIFRFFRSFSGANRDAFKRMRAYVKQRCFA